jgi:hypothetical protein
LGSFEYIEKLLAEEAEDSEAHHQTPPAFCEHVHEQRSAASTKLLRRLEEVPRTSPRWKAPKDGDFGLARRMALDGRKTNRFEFRLEGPFVLGGIAYHGRTAQLYDFDTGVLMKVKQGGLQYRCHLDDLQIFLGQLDSEPVERSSSEGQDV